MYFEEFKAGRQVITPARTITPQDIDSFMELTGLDLDLFQSDAGAQRAGHVRRLAPGPLVLSLAMGLVRQTGWFDQVVAVAGFDDLRFTKTMHPGDSLRVTAQVKLARPTRRPDQGLVVLSYIGQNQHGEAVLSCDATYLFRLRDPQAA